MSAAAPSARWPALLGNAAMLALLVAAALALLPLHGEPWWPASPQPRHWWLAGASLALYLAGCAWLLLRRRERAAADSGAPLPWLVAHVGQTGFADALAAHTVASLRAAGAQASSHPLAAVDAAMLARTGRALFIASTTGEGDPPDGALSFLRDTMAREPALPRLQYAVLALGDRDYAHFCAFGHRLDQWLRRCGASALFDLTEVDNGDPGALRHWQHHLAQAAGAAAMPDWSPPQYQRWTLAERRLLNPGSQGGPAFHLLLQPADGAMPAWQAGDIAEIGPRNAPGEVEALLATSGLDGDAQVRFGSQPMPLREALARSHLPDVRPLPGEQALHDAPQALADVLQPLPHREYSIASLPPDGALELLVRQMQREDGRPGLGSGWLCLHARPGDTIDLRIRSNPQFHPPVDDRPLILVGNGTGIAGLRALLKARAAAGAPRNWLAFGERQRAHDAFFGDEIERWQEEGMLEYCDLAWSREPEPRYVQDVLRDCAPRLREWIAAGASVHVCGSLAGMAPGVDAVLREVLGADAVDALRESGRYRRDVY